jgi:telomere length regulation protein
VEEALQLAEKYVLAMPEELEDLASDLTHALVHVKCSGIAVEGEEDIAEERRQRALLALLTCSPLQTVSVLTTELFSQHVDVSQRILILDIMSGNDVLFNSIVFALLQTEWKH